MSGRSLTGIAQGVIRYVKAFFANESRTTPNEPPLGPWSTHDANVTAVQCLAKKVGSRPALPAELILQTLDHPSRWICSNRVHLPCSREKEDPKPATCDCGQMGQTVLLTPLIVAGFGAKPRIQVLQSLPPLTADQLSTLRRVVFTFTGHDQGWSSFPPDHKTYRNTWSWFEAAVKREHGEFTTEEAEDRGEQPYKRFQLQRNVHASKEQRSYRKEFGIEHEMLRDAKEGDIIELVACAQYGGWQNVVHAYSIELWLFDKMAD
ncbi:uncharacterized protein KY384_007003 [Bacidia gigantensis]|uniref:uncharacterized protein n=1 Tax=Bacidia gigantensis TaxID=2732470 RepID=UPI001D0507AB|nr:uncharacterized protein KY384_007003 [Bacidia gigantensis]KAG8528087.1 hypothetical protein KY384_007003 [Bacidia gigantensis]